MSRANPSSKSATLADTPSTSACRMNPSKSPVSSASDNVNRVTDCPLVFVEWEDSAQPISNWSYLASFDPSGTIRCASVGWLIRDDAEMKAIAPNMGAIDDENNVQVSGVIQIPTRCVIRQVRLREPTSRPSSRPAKAPTRQAS